MDSLPGVCSIVALEASSSFSSRKETIIIAQRSPRPEIHLYLVRPLSPKGTSKLIYADAAASIRRTGQDFNTNLSSSKLIKRAKPSS